MIYDSIREILRVALKTVVLKYNYKRTRCKIRVSSRYKCIRRLDCAGNSAVRAIAERGTNSKKESRVDVFRQRSVIKLRG